MENVDALDELLVCRLDQTRKPAEPFTLVIFGASGDLAARKLLPALYQLAAKRQLPASFRIFGFARREKNDDSWRSEMKEAVQKFSKTPVAEETWAEFAGHLHYFQGDLGDAQAYAQLRARILAPAAEPSRRNLLFYLAVQPSQFGEIGRQCMPPGCWAKPAGWGNRGVWWWKSRSGRI
jgi:glucose-6-phosphate 1-dehydrogenase